MGDSELLVEDGWEAIELCYRMGWTDGLPVVPPTRELVDVFLKAGGWRPDQVLLTEPIRERYVTAEKVAINAVMAGCRPEYMPVLGAVLEAMNDPAFNLHGTISSTGGAAPVIIINGPIRHEIGVNCGANLFGPGYRANATIGRATRLIFINCLDSKPGVLDKSTQGWPGKYSICFGENEEQSPWDPYHVELGYSKDDSTVTIFASESPHNIVNHNSNTAEGVLTTVADTMSALGSFSSGQSLVVLSPEHVHYLAKDGWTKRQVKEFLFKHTKRTVADLKRAGKIPGEVSPEDETTWVHRGQSPDDIVVVVGGGEAGGHSAFFPSWSTGRGALFVTRPITGVRRGYL